MADNPTQRFGDVVDRFTEQVKPVTKGIESVTRATQQTNKIIEGLSDNLKSQIEGLGSTVDDLTKSIFDTEKPFKINFEEVNRQIGKAQATLDVLNDRLENNTEGFAQLTLKEEKAIRAQIAATEKFVQDTQQIATGSKAILQSLTAQTVGKLEETTMGALSSLPIIGPFLSTFLSDQIKIFKARKTERRKQKQLQLRQEAIEKATYEAKVDELANLTGISREEAATRLQRNKINQQIQQEFENNQQKLNDSLEQGIITQQEYDSALKELTQKTYRQEQAEGANLENKEVVISEDVNLSSNTIKEVAENVSKGVEKALVAQKPDASLLKEQQIDEKSLAPKGPGGPQKGDAGKGGFLGLGLLGPAITGVVGALTAAAAVAPAIVIGGGAIGLGLGAILTGLGLGAGIGLAAASGGIYLLGEAIDSVANPLTNLKDAVKEYEDLDGEKLAEVGEGLGALAGPMAKTGLAGILARFVGDSGIENLKGLAGVVERYQDLDPTKMGEAADALGKFGPALSSFAGESAMASFKSFVGGLLDFVTLGDDPVEKLQRFGDIADPLNSATDAMNEFTPTFEKFYKMIEGNQFEKVGDGFKDFSEKFGEGATNITKAFKGGFLGFGSGLEDIKIESMNQVSQLIESVANLTRAQSIGNLSTENADLLASGNMIPGGANVSSNIVTQNNNQGVVIAQSVDNDNLDTKIVAYNYP